MVRNWQELFFIRVDILARLSFSKLDSEVSKHIYTVPLATAAHVETIFGQSDVHITRMVDARRKPHDRLQ